jgi:hypothetical protein
MIYHYLHPVVTATSLVVVLKLMNSLPPLQCSPSLAQPLLPSCVTVTNTHIMVVMLHIASPSLECTISHSALLFSRSFDNLVQVQYMFNSCQSVALVKYLYSALLLLHVMVAALMISMDLPVAEVAFRISLKSQGRTHIHELPISVSITNL